MTSRAATPKAFLWSSLILAAASALLSQAAWAASPTTCSTNSNFVNKVRLNEAKSQGGGTGFDFIELFILDNSVKIDGLTIGIYNCNGSGCPGPKLIQVANDNGCVNSPGSSCVSTAKDSANRIYNYPTYITYALPNMDQHYGQFILLDSDGNVVDYLGYSDTSSCPAMNWAPPTGSCLVPTGSTGCAANFSSNNADLQRTTDGTGSWTARPEPTTGGTNAANSSNPPPAGAQGYKFAFSPSAAQFCRGGSGAVAVKAVWVGSDGNPLSPEQVNTSYSGGTSFSVSTTGSASLNVGNWSNGQASVQISDNSVETVGLTAVNSELPGTSSTTGSSAYNFVDCASAGAFNAVDVGKSAAEGTISTKRAGSAFSLDLYALTGGSVDAAFSGNVKLELVESCSATSAIYSGQYSLSQGKAAAASIGPVADAYPDVRVRLSYPATGTATVTVCSTDNFAIRPNSLSAPAVQDQDWMTAGTSRTLDNVSSSDNSKLHQAGRPVTIASAAYNGAATPVLTSRYNGSATLVLAACATPATDVCPSTLGTFSASSLGFSNGAASASDLTYSEVGAFSLHLEDTTFAAVDASDTAGDCTDAGRYVCSATVNVGRFVPSHFALVEGRITPAWVNSTDSTLSFSYMGQPFSVLATLQAQNAAGELTRNYTGTLAKATVAWRAENADSGSDLVSRLVLPVGAWSGGQYAVNSSNTLVSLPTALAQYGPYDSLQLGLALTDTEGSSLANAGMNSGTAGDCSASSSCNAAKVGTATRVRYGRVRLFNAYGSEKADLGMALQAQYWNGTVWVTNSLDNFTDFAASDFSFPSYYLNLSAANMGASHIQNPSALASGQRTLTLLKPSPAATGSVDVSLSLAAYTWFGTTPTARATFGIYSPETRRTVHIREMF